MFDRKLFVLLLTGLVMAELFVASVDCAPEKKKGSRKSESSDPAGNAVKRLRPSSSAKGKAKLDWWENGVFYQIYPRSFKDSNGDGIGDIRGIIEELDYLQELGIDGAWLSPIFKSPMVDFGYDIEDYYAIDPMFGTMEDLEELFREANKRNIKIILDFVFNHSSDKCEWFEKSVRAEGKYKDYYMWAVGRNNNTEPPNNWVSCFYGSAWTYMKERDMWYYHAFAKGQPELDFRNPEVLDEIIEVFDFWLKKGANGFRMDAVNFLYEFEDLRDEPLSHTTDDPNSYEYLLHHYTRDLDEQFEVVYRLREVFDEFQRKNKDAEIVLMSESYSNDTDFPKFFSDGGRRMGTHIPFNFVLLKGMDKDSTPHHVKRIIDDKIASVPVGTRLNWVMGNHDEPRIGSLYGERRIDGLLTLIMTLPGIAVTYYGEEIGMLDNRTIPFDQAVDPRVIGMDPHIRTDWVEYTRDPIRTPFQWDGTKKFAGFMPANATAKPWLPIHSNYKQVNVASQRKNKRSTLNFYKKLVQIRKEDAFAHGTYASTVLNNNVLAYVRQVDDSDTYWVLINFSANEVKIDMTKAQLGKNIPKEFEVAVVDTASRSTKGAKVKASGVVLGKYGVVIMKARHA